MNTKRAEGKTQEPAPTGKQVHRSPNYPFVSLKRAIERAKQLHDVEGRHAVRFNVVCQRWGYQPKSSGGMQTASALRQYGLIAVENAGADRSMRLTERAIKILLDKREEERSQALKAAALEPSLYGALWQKWGAELPSDENAVSHLTIDLGFNPGTAPGVFQSYKETIEFAALGNGGVEVDHVGAAGEAEVDDQEQSARSSPKVLNSPPKPDVREEEHLRAKLAGGRMVRVLFQGSPPTRQEIGKLIALLELSKDQYPEADEEN